MSLNKSKPIIAIYLNGVGNPEFQLCLSIVRNLTNKQPSLLLFDPTNGSREDELIISGFFHFSKPEILNPANLNLSDYDLGAILFTSTTHLSSLNCQVPKELKKICFIGGIGRFDHSLQIKQAMALNVDHLISDFYPEETPSLTHKEVEYFITRYIFVPPYSDDLQIPSSKSKEKGLIVRLNDPDVNQSSASKAFWLALSKCDTIRIEDLTNLPIDRWLENCVPGPNCQYVATDVYLNSIHHFLADQCLNRGILFQPLNQGRAPSLRRAFLDGNPNLTNWLNLIAPIHKPSLRESFANLIKPTRGRENVALPTSNKDSTLNLIQDRLEEYLLSKEENKPVNRDEKILINSGNSKDCDTSYITSPVMYLFKNEPSSQNLVYTFYHLKNLHLESLSRESISITKTYFKTCIRLSTQLPTGRLVFIHIFRQILSINASELIDAFCSVFIENPQAKQYQIIARYLLVITQTSPLDETIRLKLLKRIAQLPLPLEISCIAYLASNKIESFKESLQEIRNKGVNGATGNAIYWYLRQNPTPNADKLKELEKYCQEEIKIEQDSIMTHRSLALLQILNGKGNGITDVLFKSKKTGPTFWPNQIARHELALSCLVEGDEEEAMLFLESPTNSRNRDPYDLIVRISTALICGNIPSAEKFASEMSLGGKNKVWEQDELYFCALHHCIIFRHCGLKEAEDKAINWMNLSWIPVNIRYGILLKKITPVLSPTGNILKAAQILSKQIPKSAMIP